MRNTAARCLKLSYMYNQDRQSGYCREEVTEVQSIANVNMKQEVSNDCIIKYLSPSVTKDTTLGTCILFGDISIKGKIMNSQVLSVIMESNRLTHN